MNDNETINKLKQNINYSLTTKDFENLGFSFESFLRYGQVKDEKKIIQFHKVLIKHFS
jgi:hypothetical protein